MTVMVVCVNKCTANECTRTRMHTLGVLHLLSKHLQNRRVTRLRAPSTE